MRVWHIIVLLPCLGTVAAIIWVAACYGVDFVRRLRRRNEEGES